MEQMELRTVAPRFVTIKEAARYLGCGETWVKERIRSGEIGAVHLGAGTRVIFEDLERYADRLAAETRRAV